MSHDTIEQLKADDTVEYIGDGLYATNRNLTVWLYSTNGSRILNKVCIEIDTYDNLVRYFDKHLPTS